MPDKCEAINMSSHKLSQICHHRCISLAHHHSEVRIIPTCVRRSGNSLSVTKSRRQSDCCLVLVLKLESWSLQQGGGGSVSVVGS